MNAKVENTEKILVNIGLNHFVEFKLDEALKFIDMKVRIITKQAELVREKSVETRANIKLALLCIGEKQNLIS